MVFTVVVHVVRRMSNAESLISVPLMRRLTMQLCSLATASTVPQERYTGCCETGQQSNGATLIQFILNDHTYASSLKVLAAMIYCALCNQISARGWEADFWCGGSPRRATNKNVKMVSVTLTLT